MAIRKSRLADSASCSHVLYLEGRTDLLECVSRRSTLLCRGVSALFGLRVVAKSADSTLTQNSESTVSRHTDATYSGRGFTTTIALAGILRMFCHVEMSNVFAHSGVAWEPTSLHASSPCALYTCRFGVLLTEKCVCSRWGDWFTTRTRTDAITAVCSILIIVDLCSC